MNIVIPQMTCIESQIFWIFVFFASNVLLNYTIIFPEMRRLIIRRKMHIKNVEVKVARLEDQMQNCQKRIEAAKNKYYANLDSMKAHELQKNADYLEENLRKVLEKANSQRKKFNSNWEIGSEKFIAEFDAGKIASIIHGEKK